MNDKDYYGLFIKLSLQQCNGNDYADGSKVKLHNVASKKLRRLQEKMKRKGATDILSKLLLYDDDRVKINAVSLCLEMGILTVQAENVLKDIIKNTGDSTIRLSAKMLLKKVEYDSSNVITVISEELI